MADNKKIYSIQINGIDQSIKQVDALSDSLQFLDKKIKELESRSVNISSKTSGSGAKTKDLETEDQLLKQIQKTEQQIADARREDYASLMAQKDILNDIVGEAKARAAAERLSANNYGDTMKGMKQELADIKKVMQTTEIGSDNFQKMTDRAKELTESLKKIEESYGQFGRNVGNYKSAFDEVKKVTVQVGSTAREFNSVRDASRQLTQELKAMAIAGKEDTEEYKDLAEAVHNFEMASRRAESAVNDLKASSQGMDDLLDTFESFAALGSIGQGLSAFFGFDNTEIERSIQKLVALQNVLQGIEKIRQQMNTQEGIGKIFSQGNAAIDTFVSKITGAKVGINGLTASSKAATVAVRGLSMALKAIGIGLVIGAITTLVSMLEKYTSEASEAERATEQFSNAVNELNAAYSRKIDLLSASYIRKEISDNEYLAQVFRTQAQNIRDTTEALKERAAFMNDHSWTDYLSPSYYMSMQGTGYTQQRISGTENKTAADALHGLGDYDYSKMTKDIEHAEKEFEKLNEAWRKGVDYLDEYGTGLKDWLGSLAITVGDTKDAMVGVGNAIAGDMNNRLFKAMENLKKAMADAADGVSGAETRVTQYKEEVRKLYDEMNSSKAYQSFLSNMDMYIPDEAVREKLKSILDGFQDFYNSMDENSEKWVHYWNQVRIDAMKDGNAKINAQIEENRRHEIAEYGDTQEHINDINAKYNRQRLNQQEKYNEQAKNKAKQHARELEAAEKELQSLRIQNMKDGLAKQLAQLEEERRQKIQKAKTDGIKVAEITAEINKLYDKKVLDAKQDWAYKIEQVYINMWNRIYTINHNSAQMNFETQLRDLQTQYQKLQEEAASRLDSSTASYSNQGIKIAKKVKTSPNASGGNAKESYDVEVEKAEFYTKRLQEEYNKRLTNRKQYFDELERLSIERINNEYEIERQKAEEAYNNEWRTMVNSYKAQDHEMQEHYKKGEITLEQYNEAVKRLEQERGAAEQALQDKYYSQAEERELQHQNIIKEVKASSYYSQINEYKEFMDKLNSVDSSETVKNGLGFTNIVATKRRNKILIESYQKLKEDIVAKKQELQTALDNNEITFDDFEKAKKELSGLEANVDIAMKNIVNSTNTATQQLISEIAQFTSQIGSALNNLVSAMGDYTDQQYENQINELEDFIEKYEEKLQEQQEITQQHASEVDSIEQQLADARGARRQALIDKLNAEMAAQRASLAEEKRLEKEKKKLEDKKEKEEKERLKAQKKVQTVQAIINGAVAVTNALATQPVWLGIALAAVMAAATAVQIATIQSQKYAQGGVIQGKSHAQGGVKVLGGQAEVEGGEYITNKVTTEKNVQLLEYINGKKRKLDLDDMIEFYSSGKGIKKNISSTKTKFADGGVIPQLRNDINLSDRMMNAFEEYSNRPVQVAVVDIIDRTQQVNDVKVMAGLEV